MHYSILIFAEQRSGMIPSVCFELIRRAGRLAGQAGGSAAALLLGFQTTEAARQLARSGADEVITVEQPFLADYMAAAYTSAMTEAIRLLKPDIVLFGSTAIGMELAARTAARLNTCLLTDCTGLELDPADGSLLMTRPGSDGESLDTFVCSGFSPQMAAIRPGVLSDPSWESSVDTAPPKEAVVRPLNLTIVPGQDGIRLLGVEKNSEKIPDITKARILISGGRGVGGPEGFQPLKTIAGLLDGEIACSRACVEAGWIDAAFQVGQTGKTVRPDLYLACGISGAFQHVAGMSGSRLVIAINQNPAAPIFNTADLGIVGNLETILPQLIEALKEYKENNKIPTISGLI